MRVRSVSRALRVGGLAALVVVLLVAAAACSGDDSSGGSTNTTTGDGRTSTSVGAGGTTTTLPGTPTPAELDLSDRSFVSSKITGHGLVSGTTVTLDFPNPAEVSAKAGCNSLSGGFSVEGGALVVSNMRSTLIGCSPELQAQDEWVSQFLTSKPKVTLDGKQLTLTATDASVTFEEAKTG